eukprot:TRINITY_DN13058_c0_g1_i1.p1 TRINITY_DN13058_c0_g1~~TRINITY_DN13058_c0_g1_i1.p1  ORF type:complete len:355 (-),score=80.65 TRINITY_DN13058_c0_g1_i1:13-1077(-)
MLLNAISRQSHLKSGSHSIFSSFSKPSSFLRKSKHVLFRQRTRKYCDDVGMYDHILKIASKNKEELDINDMDEVIDRIGDLMKKKQFVNDVMAHMLLRCVVSYPYWQIGYYVHAPTSETTAEDFTLTPKLITFQEGTNVLLPIYTRESALEEVVGSERSDIMVQPITLTGPEVFNEDMLSVTFGMFSFDYGYRKTNFAFSKDAFGTFFTWAKIIKLEDTILNIDRFLDLLEKNDLEDDIDVFNNNIKSFLFSDNFIVFGKEVDGRYEAVRASNTGHISALTGLDFFFSQSSVLKGQAADLEDKNRNGKWLLEQAQTEGTGIDFLGNPTKGVHCSWNPTRVRVLYKYVQDRELDK